MANLDTLVSAGLIPDDHSLTDDDIDAINRLGQAEIDALIALKAKLGDDFLQRNLVGSPNCFL